MSKLDELEARCIATKASTADAMNAYVATDAHPIDIADAGAIYIIINAEHTEARDAYRKELER